MRDRPRQPVLEGLVGLDRLRRRHAGADAARDLRAPGLRLRRQAPDCARLARDVWGDPALRRALEREAAELKRRFNRGLLDPRAQLLRAGARRPEAQGRLADLEHRPPAVERDRRRRQGRQLRQAPDGRRAVLRLGRAHHGLERGVVQPDRLPRRHGLAARQLVHRLGSAPLRLQGRGGADLPRDARGGRAVRRPAARGVRRLPAPETTIRSSIRPRAARRPGRPARRCCSCARCWGSTPTAST